MRYPLVPLIQRKVHQICASTGIPGAKAHLTFSGRGHYMGKRNKGSPSRAVP
uniref:Adipogenin n=1 Tax=Chinchilla lanigera TaxID=34839 RepID=A0A8C2VIJ6_CHILA